jgi:hypothetical protein
MVNPNLVSWTGCAVQDEACHAAGISNLPGWWKKCVIVKGEDLEKSQEFGNSGMHIIVVKMRSSGQPWATLPSNGLLWSISILLPDASSAGELHCCMFVQVELVFFSLLKSRCEWRCPVALIHCEHCELILVFLEPGHNKRMWNLRFLWCAIRRFVVFWSLQGRKWREYLQNICIYYLPDYRA